MQAPLLPQRPPQRPINYIGIILVLLFITIIVLCCILIFQNNGSAGGQQTTPSSSSPDVIGGYSTINVNSLSPIDQSTPAMIGIFTEQEINQITKSINDKRALHDSPPLKYDPAISTVSQKWAETMAETNDVRHRQSLFPGEWTSSSSSKMPYGENIHVKFGSQTLGMSNVALVDAAIDSWYNEVQNYDFANPSLTSSSKQIGHFTCLVWKSSTLYGIGIARKDDKVYIVMNTYPKQINDRDTIAANVLRTRN